MRSVKKIAVIGSGPSGLAAAYTAALSGAAVTVFEQLPSPGRRLLASGGGKCNVCNILSGNEFAEKFGRQWRFTLPALSVFSGKTLVDFFDLHGVKLIAEDGFHYFPESGKSADVLNLWLEELDRLSVKLRCGTVVEKIVFREETGLFELSFTLGKDSFDAVILCCGGNSFPALGGCGTGYPLAQQCGHHITKLYPGMTGLSVAESWPKECAGISLPDCIACFDLPGERKNAARGELLFTHHGVSAFAVLDFAGRTGELLEKHRTIPLKLNLLPDFEVAELERLFSNWREQHGKCLVSNQLSSLMPKRLALALLDGNDPEICQWRREDIRALAARINGCMLTVTGTESWQKAMVTHGGVFLKEVDSRTLESKLVPGLYFAGELLDIDGPCGGYNISWAFASGWLAGSSAAGA